MGGTGRPRVGGDEQNEARRGFEGWATGRRTLPRTFSAVSEDAVPYNAVPLHGGELKELGIN